MKYIWFFHTGEEQLFDLTNDPQEKTDLSGQKKYSKLLEIWRNRMVVHLEERGEEFVKDGQLQKLQRTHLYSPNYPQDKRSKKEKLKDWKKDSR